MTRPTTVPVTRWLSGGLLALASVTLALADDAPPAPWYERTLRQIERTRTEGRPELYVPLHSHHVRSAYTPEQIEHFNETPFGLGIGKGSFDDNGDWHGLFVLVFQESHAKPEYAVGYSYETFWPLAGELKFGLGFSAMVSARSDIHHYLPFPLIVPVVALDYRKFSLNTYYVPGGHGDGNVFFIFGKVAF